MAPKQDPKPKFQEGECAAFGGEKGGASRRGGARLTPWRRRFAGRGRRGSRPGAPCRPCFVRGGKAHCGGGTVGASIGRPRFCAPGTGRGRGSPAARVAKPRCLFLFFRERGKAYCREAAGGRWRRRRLGSDVAWGRGAAAGPHPRADALPRAPRATAGWRFEAARPGLGASSAFGGVPAAGGPGSGARGALPRREDCVCKMAAPRWPRHDGCCRRPAAASVRLRGQMQRPLAPGPLADEGWPPFASRVMMMMGGDGKTVSRPPAPASA